MSGKVLRIRLGKFSKGSVIWYVRKIFRKIAYQGLRNFAYVLHAFVISKARFKLTKN